MDIRYTIDGLTLTAVPDLEERDEIPGDLLGTLGGGAIRWTGGTRSRLILRGVGLTLEERATLRALVAEAAPVAFNDGASDSTVLPLALETQALIGTPYFRYRLELIRLVAD